MESLKAKARALGLWNFFLPKSQGGAGISNLEYAHLAEIMGRSRLASEAFNCSAPDTGNMEVLERYGSQEQKDQWLKPLLEGKIRSAFAMTEPHVPSSDASNISMSAVQDGDDWVLHGRKWWISGVRHPNCAFVVAVACTDPEAPRHHRQSQFIVPLDTPGLSIVRNLPKFGYLDASGHCELEFDEVRVRVRR